jgi:hypothetical protein
MPQLSIAEGQNLEVVYEQKLVGMVISSDMRWDSHVAYTIKRVNSKIWELARFKRLGAARDKMVTYYTLKIRSILMFGAACYHSALTLKLRRRLEQQQKKCLKIILGSQYKNYENARNITQLPELEALREETCFKWAVKAQSSPQHSHLFNVNQSEADTRHRDEFLEPQCQGERYYSSAIPAMTRALNAAGRLPAGRPLPTTIITNSGDEITIQ